MEPNDDGSVHWTVLLLREQLWKGARDGDVALIRDALASGVDVNVAKPFGVAPEGFYGTALIIAALCAPLTQGAKAAYQVLWFSDLVTNAVILMRPELAKQAVEESPELSVVRRRSR